MRLFFWKKKKPDLLWVGDVKPGQYLTVELPDMAEKNGGVKCISNSPETSTIQVEVCWGNYKKIGCSKHQRFVLKYNGNELKNFHLLNKNRFNTVASEPENLEAKMQQLIDEEKYEEAEELRKKINKQNGGRR